MSELGAIKQNEAASMPQDRATFYGVHYRDVTGRNQVALPKQFKKAVEEAREEQFLLMRWQNEQFLRLYTKRQFDRKLDEIRQNETLSQAQRALVVNVMAKAAEPVEPDGQGRFVLPAKWISALGIKDEVAFCGVFGYIEIWPAQMYREKEAAEQAESAALSAAVTGILNA